MSPACSPREKHRISLDNTPPSPLEESCNMCTLTSHLSDKNTDRQGLEWSLGTVAIKLQSMGPGSRVCLGPGVWPGLGGSSCGPLRASPEWQQLQQAICSQGFKVKAGTLSFIAIFSFWQCSVSGLENKTKWAQPDSAFCLQTIQKKGCEVYALAKSRGRAQTWAGEG